MEVKKYRFSPIQSKKELLDAITYIHIECNKLCKESFNMYLPNAGNMTVCCHYEDEFAFLTELRKELTVSSNNPDQKFFLLHKPITIAKVNGIPETTYRYLYIRRPREDTSEVGNIDFYLEVEEYQKIKGSLIKGEIIRGARIYNRKDLDMIELYDPAVDVLGYVSTPAMTERVRVKQSDETIL